MTDKKTKTDIPVVSPLLDVHGNPSLVAADQIIESAWGNSVVGRVVTRYPNKAALDAASASNGALAVTTDYATVWIRDAGSWKPSPAGRVISFYLKGSPGQTVPRLANTVTAWTEGDDPFGVVSGNVFTVPSGWGGRWMFEWAVKFPGPSAGARRVWCDIGSHRLGEQQVMTADSDADVFMSGSGSAVLAGGTPVNLVVYHSAAAALVINDTVDQYFQGYYVGPY
jgi:hypothetical protein